MLKPWSSDSSHLKCMFVNLFIGYPCFNNYKMEVWPYHWHPDTKQLDPIQQSTAAVAVEIMYSCNVMSTRAGKMSPLILISMLAVSSKRKVYPQYAPLFSTPGPLGHGRRGDSVEQPRAPAGSLAEPCSRRYSRLGHCWSGRCLRRGCWPRDMVDHFADDSNQLDDDEDWALSYLKQPEIDDGYVSR